MSETEEKISEREVVVGTATDLVKYLGVSLATAMELVERAQDTLYDSSLEDLVRVEG